MADSDSSARIRSFIVGEVAGILDRSPDEVDGQTRLIGSERAIKSFQLVELLLAVEDYCESELGFEFDWESDSALSEARSFLRTIDDFAAHLSGLSSRVP